MPLFEYRCRKCQSVTEVLVRRSADEDDVTCDECGSKRVDKMMSAAAVGVKREKPACGREEMPCAARDGACKTPACQLAR